MMTDCYPIRALPIAHVLSLADEKGRRARNVHLGLRPGIRENKW